jgi:hypothetical protein
MGPVEDPRYQQAVEDSLRGPDGTFVEGANPATHPYGRLTNDGGPTVAGRDRNCVDAALAGLSSFHGDPQVAAPRWTGTRPDGTPDTGGEADGKARVERWLDGEWLPELQRLPDSYADRMPVIAAQYADIHRQVAEAGPGASAFVAVDWVARHPDTGLPLHDADGKVISGGGHAFIVVYPHGAEGPVWWDVQSGHTLHEPPGTWFADTAQVHAMAVGARAADRPGWEGAVHDAGRGPAAGDPPAGVEPGDRAAPVRVRLVGGTDPDGRGPAGVAADRAGLPDRGPVGRGHVAPEPSRPGGDGGLHRGPAGRPDHWTPDLAGGRDHAEPGVAHGDRTNWGDAGHHGTQPDGRDQERAGKIAQALTRMETVLGTAHDGGFVTRVDVKPDGVATVTPRDGVPYDVRLYATDTGGADIVAGRGPDGVREVAISQELLDAQRGVHVDVVVARALGHVAGDVAAGGRTHRFPWLHRQTRDALTNDVRPARRPHLSSRDLSKVGEFQHLARLREAETGSGRARTIEKAIREFIDGTGLRDGAPGADERSALISEHLPPAAREMLAEHRAVWHDSDPARAAARRSLGGRLDRADVTPVHVGDTAHLHDIYRVEPDGWRRKGLPSFTIEIRSARVESGRLVELERTDLARHLTLKVDRNVFKGFTADDPHLRYRLSAQIKHALDRQILEQAKHPPLIRSWRSRATHRGTDAAVAGGSYELGDRVLHDATIAGRSLAAPVVSILTDGHFTRVAAMDAAEAAHDRALAQRIRTDPVTRRELRGGLSDAQERVAAVADTSGLGRDSLGWTPASREPRSVESTADVPDDAAQSIKAKVDANLDTVADGAREAGVTKITDSVLRKGYRVNVQGGRGAQVRIEVGNTPDRGKVHVEITGRRRYTLTVPPELLDARPARLNAALSDAFGRVAGDQRGLSRQVAHPVVQTGVSVAPDAAQHGATREVLDRLAPHSGDHGVLMAIPRKFIDLVRGPRAGESDAALAKSRADWGKTWRKPQFSDTEMANATRQTIEAARNLGLVARFVDARAEHGQPPNLADLVEPPRYSSTAVAVHTEVERLSAERGGVVTLHRSDGDPTQGYAGATAVRFDFDLGGVRHARLDVRFGTDPADAATPVRRTGWGRFEVTIGPARAPDEAGAWVRTAAADIIDRRGEGTTTFREAVRSKLPSAVVAAAVGGVLFAQVHKAASVFAAGISAGAAVLSGVVGHAGTLHMVDKALEREFAGRDPDRLTIGDLHDEIGRTADQVETFERRITDRLTQSLDDLTARGQDPGLSAADRAALQHRVDEIRTRLDSIGPPDHVVLGPLHHSLPRLSLPNGGNVHLVDAEHNVFRLSYDRPSKRQYVAFDLTVADTGGEVVALRRTASDTGFSVIVDRAADPGRVQAAIARNLSAMTAQRPNRTEPPGSRAWLKGTANALGQATAATLTGVVPAAAVTNAIGGVAGPVVGQTGDNIRAQAQARRGFLADLAVQTRSGTATTPRILVFGNRVSHLAGRMEQAVAVEHWLDQHRGS